MITLIYGPNNYLVRQAVTELQAPYEEAARSQREGADISPSDLPELLQGVNMFAAQRIVVIKNASGNKQLWDALSDFIAHVADEVNLVIVETGPDKRTKTFKILQKHADIVKCDELNEAQAIQWLLGEAVVRGGTLERRSAQALVERVGTDQWQLSHELEKLLLIGDTSVEVIKQTIEATPQANAFALLDAAFARRTPEVQRLLKDCITQEDPYKFFGLLASQIFQLVVVVGAPDKTPEQIAKDIGAHPYPIKKMQAVAKKLSKTELSVAIEATVLLDDQMKRSAGEPWLLIETALLKIANR